jgi:hypothetical protein
MAGCLWADSLNTLKHLKTPLRYQSRSCNADDGEFLLGVFALDSGHCELPNTLGDELTTAGIENRDKLKSVNTIKENSEKWRPGVPVPPTTYTVII